MNIKFSESEIKEKKIQKCYFDQLRHDYLVGISPFVFSFYCNKVCLTALYGQISFNHISLHTFLYCIFMSLLKPLLLLFIFRISDLLEYLEIMWASITVLSFTTMRKKSFLIRQQGEQVKDIFCIGIVLFNVKYCVKLVHFSIEFC